MDLNRLYLVLVAITVACFAGAGIIALGELLGWWQDWGEVGLIILTIIGAFVGVITLLFGSTKGQVGLVVVGVADGNRKLDILNASMGHANEKLDHANEKLDHANDKLDHANHKLDGIAGLLQEQTRVLREIRDRPGGPA